MITLDTLEERNRDFAAHQLTSRCPSFLHRSRSSLVVLIRVLILLTYLGLEFGDALVIRNIGGRITPETLQTIAMLQAVARVQ